MTGCGQERLLKLESVPAYWSVERFTDHQFVDDVSTKEKKQLLKTCKNKKTTALPSSYRILNTYEMYFSLKTLEMYGAQTEVFYLAEKENLYLACRSRDTHQLKIHPVEAKDHPWVKVEQGTDKTPLQTPTFFPVTEKQRTRHADQNREAKTEGDFSRRLAPFHNLHMPIAGQILVILTENNKEHVLVDVPTSFINQTTDFYLTTRPSGNGANATYHSITFESPGWYLQDRIVMTTYDQEKVDMTYHPLPETLTANQTIPYVTLRAKNDLDDMEEKTLSLRYQPVYQKVKLFEMDDEERNDGIKGFLHPTIESLQEGNIRKIGIMPDELSLALANELKQVTLEQPQGNKPSLQYFTLVDKGKTQTFTVYLKKRAQKTDVYLQDTTSKKGTKLSGELAAQLAEQIEGE
ncbi:MULTISPECIES: hypothetical protein [unclassified Exiguobacterium]|uniref:hypothetical protein n=1 Tax=unclassified Exiguobacterium TaxID=2644629 RepID=UPI000B59389E|nr:MULTISPECIES: hypothetical protein [unclassified Exiguobacterium]ASI35470.1 hypothetical protein A0126_07815 [Exiguobacterium sp. N4-1P]ASI37479.1 hypothetical protein A0126_18080 [Exiguobacterium sp. N4-1P]